MRVMSMSRSLVIAPARSPPAKKPLEVSRLGKLQGRVGRPWLHVAARGVASICRSERIHLRPVEPPSGADRAMARQPRCDHRIQPRLQQGSSLRPAPPTRRRGRAPAARAPANRAPPAARAPSPRPARMPRSPDPAAPTPRRVPAGATHRPPAGPPPPAAAAAAVAHAAIQHLLAQRLVRPAAHGRRAGQPAPASRRRRPRSRRYPAPVPPARLKGDPHAARRPAAGRAAGAAPNASCVSAMPGSGTDGHKAPATVANT